MASPGKYPRVAARVATRPSSLLAAQLTHSPSSQHPQGRSHPSLSLTSSLLLSQLPPSSLTSPYEPLAPLLLPLSVHPSLPPYLAHLATLLTRLGFPALAVSASAPLDRSDEARAAREAELERLVEGAEAAGVGGVRGVVEKVWRRAVAGDGEEEGAGRDVRSL